MSFVMSIDEFKSRLFLSVLPTSKTVEDDYNVPCLNKGTFRLVPRLLLGEKDSDGIYETSAAVTHDMEKFLKYQNILTIRKWKWRRMGLLCRRYLSSLILSV